MNINEIVDNFTLLEDWEERYRYLISLGGNLPAFPDSLRTSENKVQGCMSQVWMVLAWDKEGRLRMQADSDAQIVRGLVAVLYAIFHGKTADELTTVDAAAVFRSLGLDQHLTPNRRNGFFAMLERINAFIAAGT